MSTALDFVLPLLLDKTDQWCTVWLKDPETGAETLLIDRNRVVCPRASGPAPRR